LEELSAEKPISCAKLTHFDFITINFIVWSHILNIDGDALRQLREWHWLHYEMSTFSTQNEKETRETSKLQLIICCAAHVLEHLVQGPQWTHLTTNTLSRYLPNPIYMVTLTFMDVIPIDLQWSTMMKKE
jgi:hypothetical protein